MTYPHRQGVLCEFCSVSLKGMFVFKMSGYDKVKGFYYCPMCEEVYRIKQEKV